MRVEGEIDVAGLRERVAGRPWYHTMDLGHGIVTPGEVDCRPVAAKTLIPPRLDGMRVLDVGTWDGFWAFELERRGAEVTTLDLPDPERLDWPRRARLGRTPQQWAALMEAIGLGGGWEIAREALGSKAERLPLSIYDVADAGLGEFDLVFVGSLLVHLRDPVRALESLRSVVSRSLVVSEAVDLIPSLTSPRSPRARFAGDGDEALWWHPNRAALMQMLRSGGFEPRRSTPIYFIPWAAGRDRPGALTMARSLTSAMGREYAVTWALGIPHCSVECELIP